MKNYIYIIILIFYSFNCNEKLKLNNKPVKIGLAADSSFVCEFDFQDNFHDDTVSFYLGSSMILSNKILSSHPVVAFTGVTVKVFKRPDLKFNIVTSLMDTIVIESNSMLIEEEKIPVKVLVNNLLYQNFIDVSYYQFIGFSKKERDKIEPLNTIFSRERFRYY